MDQDTIRRDNVIGQLWIAVGQGAAAHDFAADGVQKILDVFLSQVDTMERLWSSADRQTFLRLAKALGEAAAAAAADDGSAEIHETHVERVLRDEKLGIMRECPCS